MLHVFVMEIRCVLCDKKHLVAMDMTGRWEGHSACNPDVTVEVTIPEDTFREVIDRYIEIVRVVGPVQ